MKRDATKFQKRLCIIMIIFGLFWLLFFKEVVEKWSI